MHFKPDKTNPLGTGVIFKAIPKRDFMHSDLESQNFPYHKMKKGQQLTIYPNLSTIPQTHGLYVDDKHVCDIGSFIQECHIEVPLGVFSL